MDESSTMLGVLPKLKLVSACIEIQSLNASKSHCWIEFVAKLSGLHSSCLSRGASCWKSFQSSSALSSALNACLKSFNLDLKFRVSIWASKKSARTTAMLLRNSSKTLRSLPSIQQANWLARQSSLSDRQGLSSFAGFVYLRMEFLSFSSD